MSTQTHVMVARDRRAGMNSLVRAIQPWELGRTVSPASPDQVNALMMAKTPLSLVEAAEELGPLRSRREDLEMERKPLLLTAEQMRSLVEDGTLGMPDPQRLADECVLDPFWHISDDGRLERDGRNPIGDSRKVTSSRGPATSFDIFGPPLAGDTRLFAIEPLQDWVLLRNLLSVSMRLAGIARREARGDYDDGKGILEHAGFAEVGRTSLSSWLAIEAKHAWVLPLAFNPWFREGGIIANDLRYPTSFMHPLLDRLFELRRGKAGLGTYRALRGSGKGAGDIRVLTASAANATDVAATPRGKAPQETRMLYLALQGDDQKALADALLRSLDALLNTEDLRYTGYEIGGIPMDHRDAAGALWATFLRHEGRYLMTCRQCGRTVLSTTQGNAREFCTDTCRATYNKALREAASDR
ncbi:MAG: hypothetical protein Q4B54_14395 [Coriobacteriales bacterium]|nr:hypothetical protein [Coriobacteriales bacterium]